MAGPCIAAQSPGAKVSTVTRERTTRGMRDNEDTGDKGLWTLTEVYRQLGCNGMRRKGMRNVP